MSLPARATLRSRPRRPVPRPARRRRPVPSPVPRPGAALRVFVAGLTLAVAAAPSALARSGVEVAVAVASNMADAQAELAARFTAATGMVVRTSLGSTGQLYAQIRNGAPFDVFLSADGERPRLLEADGLAVPDSRFVYARGRLVLLGGRGKRVRPGGADLRETDYRYLAIANPRTAPYGAAAAQALVALGLQEVVADRIVRGETIGQAYQYVKTGAAEWGLVALSQVRSDPAQTYWVIPERLHDPIEQEAVLLARAAGNEAAREYVRFLASAEARAVLEAFGYTTTRQ